MTTTATEPLDPQQQLARRLGLVGLLEHWAELPQQTRDQVLQWQAEARRQRSLQRRIGAAKLGRFKAMADFNWRWPRKLDRALVDELFTLDFVRTGCNAVLIGQQGTGKTMICKNHAHQAVMAGYTVRMLTASELLRDLSEQPDARTRHQRLKHYCEPDLLAIDQLGYQSYDHRCADLFFELIDARYQRKSTMITTNLTFSRWNEVFPSATSVLAVVERVIHHAEIVQIDADSWRLKDATEQREQRAAARSGKVARA